jgi:hypothetical protein
VDPYQAGERGDRDRKRGVEREDGDRGVRDQIPEHGKEADDERDEDEGLPERDLDPEGRQGDEQGRRLEPGVEP